MRSLSLNLQAIQVQVTQLLKSGTPFLAISNLALTLEIYIIIISWSNC